MAASRKNKKKRKTTPRKVPKSKTRSKPRPKAKRKYKKSPPPPPPELPEGANEIDSSTVFFTATGEKMHLGEFITHRRSFSQVVYYMFLLAVVIGAGAVVYYKVYLPSLKANGSPKPKGLPTPTKPDPPEPEPKPTDDGPTRKDYIIAGVAVFSAVVVIIISLFVLGILPRKKKKPPVDPDKDKGQGGGPKRKSLDAIDTAMRNLDLVSTGKGMAPRVFYKVKGGVRDLRHRKIDGVHYLMDPVLKKLETNSDGYTSFEFGKEYDGHTIDKKYAKSSQEEAAAAY